MQDWSIPLMVATGAFLAFLLWRVRPMMPWGGPPGASRQALREAQARIDGAKDEPQRALALCDAAALMSPGRASGLYLRAMRADPKSVEVVARVVAGLSRRPRRLESLLWRHLGTSPWKESREATRAVLDALRALYEGPLRNAVRANALAHARDAIADAHS